MNRSSPGTSKSKVSLSLAKAIDGFLKFKTAEGLSHRTITSYEFTLGHWLKYIGDREVSDIQSSDLTGYMAWLRTEFKPRRWNGSSEPLSAWLEENLAEGFTVFDFPLEHRRIIRTTNSLERINKEIRRRTRVVGVFPNEASCLRLISALLMETSEEWQIGKH